MFIWAKPSKKKARVLRAARQLALPPFAEVGSWFSIRDAELKRCHFKIGFIEFLLL